jgi:hypothetical protein
MLPRRLQGWFLSSSISDLTVRPQFPSGFAFQLIAKEFAHLRSQTVTVMPQPSGKQRDTSNSSQFAMDPEHPFVIPSEVEKSLAIQKIFRDVSTSLDMTEMRYRKHWLGRLNPPLTN